MVVARKAKVRPVVVVSVFWMLLDYASQHQNRGCVEDFDIEVTAAFLGIEDEEVSAVLTALQDKGIIIEGRIANWEKRQPKREREDDSAPRVQRHREANRAQSQPSATTVTPSQTSVTPCNAIVTPRNAQRDREIERERERLLPPYPHGGDVVAGESFEDWEEQETDIFCGDVEPLPPPLPRAKRAQISQERREKVIALFQAFRAVRFERPETDPISPAELDRASGAFYSILEAGGTPEQVRQVVDYALRQWPNPKAVTPKTISEHWTALLSDASPRTPALPKPRYLPLPTPLPVRRDGVLHWAPGCGPDARKDAQATPPSPDAPEADGEGAGANTYDARELIASVSRKLSSGSRHVSH